MESDLISKFYASRNTCSGGRAAVVRFEQFRFCFPWHYFRNFFHFSSFFFFSSQRSNFDSHCPSAVASAGCPGTWSSSSKAGDLSSSDIEISELGISVIAYASK
jgi:hypothetical protein